MSQVRGVADLGIFPVLGQPNLNIKIDRAKAARYGLNSGDVNSVIQAAMGGATATSVLEGDRQFELVVRYTPEYRDSIEKIGNIRVAYQTSQRRQCLRTPARTGHDQPGYRARPGFITKACNASSRSNSASADATLAAPSKRRRQRIAKNVKLPSGYRLVWAGEFGDLQEAKQRLEIIVPISLVLIAGLLYSLFNDCATAFWRWPEFPLRSLAASWLSTLPVSISASPRPSASSRFSASR